MSELKVMGWKTSCRVKNKCRLLDVNNAFWFTLFYFQLDIFKFYHSDIQNLYFWEYMTIVVLFMKCSKHVEKERRENLHLSIGGKWTCTHAVQPLSGYIFLTLLFVEASNESIIQWGSEYWTSLVCEWSKGVR